VTGATRPLVLTAAEVAEASGGRLRRGSTSREIGSFTTDSRKVAPGQFFIALRGERFDGAAYAAASVEAGAIGVMVPPGTEIGDRPDVVVIEVEDTLLGLQRLGHYVRRQSGADVVAITGSAGKTSTKEATAAFLAARYAVYRNAGNLNNHIGLPLSLLELTARPDVAVVELGMNHAGEIRRLVEIAEPDVRVWTNVGDAHIGFFASADAIADAKAEVLDEAPIREPRAGTGSERHDVAALARFAPAELREALREQRAPLRQRPCGAGAEVVQAMRRRLCIEERNECARHVGRVNVVCVAERREYSLAAGPGDARDLGRHGQAVAYAARVLPAAEHLRQAPDAHVEAPERGKAQAASLRGVLGDAVHRLGDRTVALFVERLPNAHAGGAVERPGAGVYEAPHAMIF